MAKIYDNKKKKITAKPQGVFEALKDIGSYSSPQTEFTASSAQNALQQLANRAPVSALPSKDQGLFTKDQLKDEKEKEIRQQERFFFERKRKEERLVYSHREQEVAREIAEIQNELKRIADQIEAVGDLSQDLKTAVVQPTVEPGVYHLGFFQRIKSLLVLARKKVQESKTWLQLYMQRHKRKSHYWFMVGKKGTSYMLSPERYMATQAG